MQNISFDEVLNEVVARDPRYQRDAYHFVREALDYTQQKIVRAPKDEERHVTGQELLRGIRELALDQFGPMTLTVFEEWGVRRGEDFGEIVFNMVESSLLKKTEQDTRAAFAGSYDFVEAFRKPFQPSRPGVVDPAPAVTPLISARPADAD